MPHMMKTNLKLLLIIMVLLPGIVSAQSGRTEVELSGDGWNLWLDHAAVWAHDAVYLPPVDISNLPVNPPTVGWEALHNGDASDKIVEVPGTVEQHYWGEIGGIIPNSGGDFVGVSWWSRMFELDPSLKNKRIFLDFESVNLRAEVYVNGQLVGYDVIGNTPFQVEATDAVNFGEENTLDIRITDPVGNFSWNDNILMRWGENLVPAVHGFGGITGPVKLIAADEVKISDIYVQNQPNPKEVEVFVTLKNYNNSSQKGDVTLRLHEYGNPNNVVWEETLSADISSEEVIQFSADVENANLWELAGYKGEGEEDTALYEATAEFKSDNGQIADSKSQRFGFRWFDVGEKDGDKRFYLNGERVFILAAMTRGFWPVNGIFATPEMAERDKEMLQRIGFNMMLLHRAIGQPPVMEYADKSGMLAYEEPGGYRVTPNRWENIEGPDEQALEWRREKLRRMIIRDRSLPSMIIYNLKNEATNPPTEDDVANVKMVHELDPSRIITYNSDRNRDIEYYERLEKDPYKLHMLPFDDTLYYSGWFDQHHWFSYSGYVDENYNSPNDYLRGNVGAPRIPQPEDSTYALDKSEVIFWGEEGAFGTMVRLQKIKEELDNTGSAGFREKEHIDWYNHYNEFLDKTGFRESYPDVDALTMSLGRNLHYFQARSIENVRLSNIGDAYNMNGWGSASTRTDVVDMYRNPTADPDIIAHYTQPLYVAVKLRKKVLETGENPVVDFYIINEEDLKGSHTLSINYSDPAGRSIFREDFQVEVTGGETYGELLVEKVRLPEIQEAGYYHVTASLKDGNEEKASGHDEVFSVDISSDAVPEGRYAVLEEDNTVKDFMMQSQGIQLQEFSADVEEIDAVIVGNHEYENVDENTLHNLMDLVKAGTKLIVLQNADKYATAIDSVLQNRPAIHQGEEINSWNGGARLFVGKSPVLDGLPQSEGMSWEYQAFYKTWPSGRNGQVGGIDLHNWGTELIVAMGGQFTKEIMSALSRVQVGEGDVYLSTLSIPENLASDNSSSVVAKKLFLNLLKN